MNEMTLRDLLAVIPGLPESREEAGEGWWEYTIHDDDLDCPIKALMSEAQLARIKEMWNAD